MNRKLFSTSIRKLGESSLVIPPAVQATTIKSSSTASSNAPIIPQTQENQHLVPAYVTSDAPDYLLNKRIIRIFKPTSNPMQSGRNETRYWQIDFDAEQKWENPLMGWASSADSVQALRLRFHEKMDAIGFAEKQGWDYVVQEEQPPRPRPKSYANNFKYSSKKLRLVSTK